MAINCSLIRRKQLQEIKDGLDKRFKHLSNPVIENWIRMWRTYNNTAADPTAEDINKMLRDRASEMLDNTMQCFSNYCKLFNSNLDKINRLYQNGDITNVRTQPANQELRKVREPENIGLDKDYTITNMHTIVATNNEIATVEDADIDLIGFTPNGDVFIVNDSSVPSEVYEQQKEILRAALGSKFKGTIFGYSYSKEEGLKQMKDREYFASIPYNEKQKDAIEEATDFALNGDNNETFMIEGKAGTGKTTIAKEVVYKFSKEFKKSKDREPKILMITLSHKAKEVLDESLGDLKKETPHLGLTTIAAALGKREKIINGKIVFETDPKVREKPIVRPDLIIIDESSMVSQSMLNEIMALKKPGTKVITMGDDGQLPPIEDSAGTHSPTFDTKNKAQLFERVRQGEASPILPYADKFWNQGTSKNPNLSPFKIPLKDIVQSEGALLVAKNRKSVLNNLVNAFKYALSTGNYNYVKYIAYQNKTVDYMNNLIHEAVAGDRVNPNTGFADGEFIIFNQPFYRDDELVAPSSYEATIIKQGNTYTDSRGFKCCDITIKHKYIIETIPVIVRSELQRYNEYLKNEADRIVMQVSPKEKNREWAIYYDFIKEHANIDFAYAITSHKSQGSTYNISITDLNDIGGVQGPDIHTKNKSAYVGITRAKNVAVVLTSNATQTTARDFNDVNNKVQNKSFSKNEITTDNNVPESNASMTVKAEPIADLPQTSELPTELPQDLPSGYMDSLVQEYAEVAKNSSNSAYSEMGFDVNPTEEVELPSADGIREASEHFNNPQELVQWKNNTLSITPAKSVDKKATAKGSISNKFIGFADGIKGSSTAIYAHQAGDKANVGIYDSNDVIFVSIPGVRGDKATRHAQQDKTINEALKALEAGATLITDNKTYVQNSDYNEGEKKLAAALEHRGANYSEKVVNGERLGVWKLGNNTINNAPKISIPQNRVSGKNQYGFTQTAKKEITDKLGENVTSIDMVEAGYRTRTTRSVSEVQKYNLSVGDVFEQYGVSKDGTTKKVLTRVTAIYGQDDPRFLGNWNKEGWTDEGIEDIKRLKEGAKAIEFELTTDTINNQPIQQQTTILGPETTINIYAGTGENADLSNFAERPFDFDDDNLDTLNDFLDTISQESDLYEALDILAGESFKNVESAFQAVKSVFSNENSRDILNKLKNTTGAEAKTIGRNLKNLDTEKWDKISGDVMRFLIKVSFQQNPQALQRLLATGNATLTHTQDKSKWSTEFPKLLMEVRDELRNNTTTTQQTYKENGVELVSYRGFSSEYYNTNFNETSQKAPDYALGIQGWVHSTSDSSDAAGYAIIHNDKDKKPVNVAEIKFKANSRVAHFKDVVDYNKKYKNGEINLNDIDVIILDKSTLSSNSQEYIARPEVIIAGDENIITQEMIKESGIPFTLTEENKGKQPIKLNNNKTEVASLKDEQEAAEAFLAQQRVAATNKITASDAAALGMNNDNTNIPDAIKPDADVSVIPTQSRRQEIKQVFTPAVRNELTTNVAELFTEFLFEEIEEYKAELQNEQEQYRNANGKNDESITLKLEALEDKETCVPIYLEAKGIQNIIQRISETIEDRVSQYEEFAEEYPEQKDRALMLRDRVANSKTYLEDLLADAAVQIEEATGARLSFDNKNGIITATANESSATEEMNDTEVDDNEEGDSTIAGGSELIEGVKYRFVDPFALMSKEVKMMLSRIEMADANIGKDNNWDEDHFVYGWLGNERHMPVKQTYAILLDAFSKYVNKPEDFYYKDDNDEYHFPVLDILKEQHYWARFLERNLRQALAEDNREVLSKFYTAMRMDFITYDAIKHNDNDEVQSFSLNQKEKANGIMKETVANTVNGIRLTLNDVYTHDAETCINNAKSALERNKQIIENLNYIRTANVNDDLSEDIENAVTEVHNALAKLGIDIHPAIIRSMITNTRGQSTVKTPIVEVIERVNQIMQRIAKNKSLNEADVNDNKGKISDFRNIVNNQRYDYSWLCRMFSDFSELNNESSFKSTDGKKNYQSYSTPNFMGDLVHTFTNYDSWKRKAESLSDDYFVGKQILKVKQSYDENEKSAAIWIPVGKNEKIKLQDKIDILVREYLMEKYGNKEWYYKEGKWRNSVLELFYCNASKIMADGSFMSKKELIEIDGETYRDWNGGMISKSMLERYFKDNVTLNDIIRQDGSIMDHLNITSFNTPILADSPVCMLNMQERVCSEYDTENPNAEVLSRFRDIVKQEIDRIKLVKARKKAKVSPIANFDKTGKKNPRGEEFCFFPSLNDGFFDKYIELESKASEETLNSVIDARIKGIIEDTLREEEKYANLEIIKSNSDFKTDEEAIKAYNAFVINGMLARTAMIELTTVDLAYYKDWTDFQKRFKEIYANGKKLDTNSRYGRKMERVIYLKDLTGMSRQFSKLKSILDRAVKTGEMKSYDRDNFLSKFKDINSTDAQSFRTLSSLRAVMDMVGNWNKKQQRAFENLQQGIFNPQDLDIAWQTIKPYMFTIVDKNDGFGGKISVPHQNKNSEFLLLTMFNVIGSSAKSPMMVGLNRFMEKNDIDVATFESAVKAGCEGAIDISHSTVKDKNGKTKLDRWIDSHNDEWANMLEDLRKSLNDEQKFNGMSNWDKYLQASMVQFEKGVISQEQYNDRMDAQEPSEQEVYDMLEDSVFLKDDKGNPTSMPNPDVLHELPYDNYCIQQPTPEHLFDAEVIFGSQFRNLIIADLPDTDEFRELKEDYIRAINMNLQESFDKVKKLFTGKNGLIKLQKKLLEQIKGNPKYGREIEAALELVEITDEYGNKRVDFNIPLDNPNTTMGMQELLLSVFKNQITKQHIKGAACVLVSNVGYTKELNIVYNEDGNKDSGVKHIECYLPAASKRFYQPFLKKNADGSVELDYSRLPEDLKQGIGYRIPTESKYSMIPLYVKGFLPQQNGSAIMLPEEITTMAGSDFDIDKLFMILPEFYEKKTYDYKKAWSDFYNANPELNKLINKAQWNSYKESLKQPKETNPEAAEEYDFTKEFKDWFVKNSGIKKYEWVEGTKDKFNEWFNQNKDSYVLKTEFKRVKDGFYSREARNNLILSISHKILTSKEIAPQLLRAGNFDEAKMLARIASIIDNQDLLNAFMQKQGIALTEAEEAKIQQNFDGEQIEIERRKLLVKKTKALFNQIMKDHNLDLVDSFFKKYVKQNNPLTLGGFISNHEQNMLGGKMIGIYANNTTQQAKYQNSGLRLKDEFVFTFNGRKIRECDLVKNHNNEYVSQNCAQFSAASVDNAKDPILKALYQNPDTANITGFLLRAGFTLQEASLIFAHPVFRKMYEQGKLTAYAVKKEFDNANKARGLESVDITDYDFTSDELFQQILESRLEAEDVNLEEYQVGQIRFLGLLYKVLAGAEAINTLTMNSRSDSPNGAAKPRISMVDNQLFRIDQLNYSFNNPDFALTGVRNLVSNTMDENYIAESKTPMLQAFHSYGLASIPSLLQDYFIQYIPEVRKAVTYLLEQSPRKNRDMLLQNFYQQLVEYALTNTDLFGTTKQSTLEDKRQYYIYDFPAEFLKVVASKPELKDSGLFKVLTVKEGDLRYTGNTNNTIAFQYLQDQMEDLLYSDDVELKKLATDLFMYSFYKEGLSYGGSSVGKLFSTSFLTSIPEYINTVRNAKVIAKNPEFMHKFVSQFLANNTEIACTNFNSVKREKDSAGNIAVNAKYAVNKNILGKGRTDEPMLYEYISIDGTMYVLRGVNNKKAIYSPAPTFNKTNTGDIKESYYNARSTVEAMVDNKIDDNAVKRNKQAGVKKSSYLDSFESISSESLEGHYSDYEGYYQKKETTTEGNFLDNVPTQQKYPLNENAVSEPLC